MATKKTTRKSSGEGAETQHPRASRRGSTASWTTKTRRSRLLPAPISAAPSPYTEFVSSIHRKGCSCRCRRTLFQKDGKTEYSDIFHPVTADARSELNSKVLEAYEQKLDEVESENEDPMRAKASMSRTRMRLPFGQKHVVPNFFRFSLDFPLFVRILVVRGDPTMKNKTPNRNDRLCAPNLTHGMRRRQDCIDAQERGRHNGSTRKPP